MTPTRDDPRWPRASAWLGAAHDRRADLGVIGAPSARGSITPGRCDLAPPAIRAALARYSPYDASRNRDLGAIAARDFGDIGVATLSIEDAFEPLREGVAAALDSAAAVAILGGDNSVTRPGVRALGECGLITFDAHFDLRDLDRGLSNGNPIRALLRDGFPGRRIVQIGIQSFANSKAYGDVAREAGITFFTAEHVRLRGIEEVIAEAFRIVGAGPIYIDLDIDVLDRAFAPATPGSRPGGLHPHEIRHASRLCGANRNVRAIDFVEIDPEKDVNDATSLVAAACLLEFASGMLER